MAAATTWQVTAQLTDQVTINNAGQAVVGTRVYFITGQGNEGSVFIPQATYSEANVRKAINAYAPELDRVGNMTSN